MIYGTIANDLLARGYEPIPCAGKRPIYSDWQNKVGVNPAKHYEANVGLLTRSTPALDVDFEDSSVLDIVESVIGNNPKRIGRKGALYLFRTDAPFRKMRREYVRDSEHGAIEWLADGQQFIAYGTHPDTGRPYMWVGGRGPRDVESHDLTTVDETAALRILDEIEERLLASGWQRKAGATGSTGSMIRRSSPVEFDIPESDYTQRQIECLKALPHLDAEDYGSWIAVGHALRSEGFEFDVYDAWSRTAPNYDRDACIKRWESFNPRSAGAYSLLRAAGMSTAKLDFEPVAGAQEEPAAPAKKSPDIQTIASIAERKPPDWLVKGLIPKVSLVGLIASPNAGKSFLLLDLCAAVERAGSSDVTWFGRRVKADERSICVVFSYEGSMVVRARALRKRFDGVGSRIVIESGWPNLRDPESVSRVMERIGEIEQSLGGRVRLIAFDTLNLALAGGNENSSEDMGAAVGAIKRLRDAYRCSVVVVHHLGKDETKGARGHTSLLGALDTEITIVGDRVAPTRTIELTKCRDGDGIGGFGWFRLSVVGLGFDEDGDEMTSCVVEPTVEEEAAAGRMKEAEERVRKALEPFPGGLSKNALFAAVGGNRNRFFADLEALREAGKIEFKAGERGALLVVWGCGSTSTTSTN
jgi:hypothetical protein